MRFVTALGCWSCTDAGQDRVEVIHDGGHVVLVVADGAGNSTAGARAADAVVERVSAEIAEHGALRLNPAALLDDIGRALAARVEGGQTTAIVAVVGGGGIIGASVGDSELWLVSEGGHVALTANQRRKPLLGDQGAIIMPFSAGLSRGTLLAATDGLFKYASAASICTAARHPDLERVPELLVDAVRLRSGGLRDDVAVALCRMEG